MTLPVSVLIHTLNEEDQIEACLRSVEWADEIFLLDSFSTDRTVDIVQKQFPGVRIESRKSLGSAAQKNYGMDHVSNEWVLVVDADERVTPELRDEILALLSTAPGQWAYSVGRRNFMLGYELNHSGLQRDRVTRLFHRQHARYPNRRVHADLLVDGEVGILREKMIHHYIRSFDHMIEKMTRYGVWGATTLFTEGQRAGLTELLTRPLWRFLRDYILNLGILDGRRGLIVVGMHVYTTFWKYAKLWEYTELERMGKPVPLPELDVADETWTLPWMEKSGRSEK